MPVFTLTVTLTVRTGSGGTRANFIQYHVLGKMNFKNILLLGVSTNSIETSQACSRDQNFNLGLRSFFMVIRSLQISIFIQFGLSLKTSSSSSKCHKKSNLWFQLFPDCSLEHPCKVSSKLKFVEKHMSIFLKFIFQKTWIEIRARCVIINIQAQTQF